MSGGHFHYRQDSLSQIADTPDEDVIGQTDQECVVLLVKTEVLSQYEDEWLGRPAPP